MQKKGETEFALNRWNEVIKVCQTTIFQNFEVTKVSDAGKFSQKSYKL